MAVETPGLFFAKWSLPVATITAIIGGSAWLTTTHNSVEENTRQLRLLQGDFKELDSDTEKLTERLGRIEEKIDILVKLMERRPHGR